MTYRGLPPLFLAVAILGSWGAASATDSGACCMPLDPVNNTTPSCMSAAMWEAMQAALEQSQVSGAAVTMLEGRQTLLLFCIDPDTCALDVLDSVRVPVGATFLLDGADDPGDRKVRRARKRDVTAKAMRHLQRAATTRLRGVRPLSGYGDLPFGDSAKHSRTLPGTIGTPVAKGGDGDYVLGCNHAFAASNFGRVQDPIDAERDREPLASLSAYEPIRFEHTVWNHFDGAIAKLDQNRKVSAQIWHGGTYGSPQPTTTDRICIGDEVVKYGMSGRSEGVVDGIHGYFKVNFGPKTAYFKEQFVVRGMRDGERFCEEGDSGSLVMRKSNLEAVGLAFAGDRSTVVSPIIPVMDRFEVCIGQGGNQMTAATSACVGRLGQRSYTSVAVPPGVRGSWPEEDAWLIDLNFAARGAYDSNVFAVDSGQPDSAFAVFGDASVDFRRRIDVGDRQYQDFDIGLFVGGAAQDEQPQTEPFYYGYRLSWDGDVALTGRGRRVAVGAELSGSTFELQQNDFEDRLRGSLAASCSWGTHGRCELDTTVAFASWGSTNDPGMTQGDAAFDRSGTFSELGAEHRFVSNRFDPNARCQRGGPFRRESRLDSRTAFVRLSWVRDEREGSQLDHEGTLFRFGGEQQFGRRNRWALDWFGEASFFDYKRSPSGARYDDGRLLELGMSRRLPMKRVWLSYLDMRLSAGVESNDSNVPGFDFNRTVIAFGVEGRFFFTRRDGSPPITETAGSKTTSASGQAGSSRSRTLTP